MAKHLSNMEAFHQIINNNQLVVVHVMRDHCSVCHAVLPQIEDIVASYPNVKLICYKSIRCQKSLQVNYRYLLYPLI